MFTNNNSTQPNLRSCKKSHLQRLMFDNGVEGGKKIKVKKDFFQMMTSSHFVTICYISRLETRMNKCSDMSKEMQLFQKVMTAKKRISSRGTTTKKLITLEASFVKTKTAKCFLSHLPKSKEGNRDGGKISIWNDLFGGNEGPGSRDVEALVSSTSERCCHGMVRGRGAQFIPPPSSITIILYLITVCISFQNYFHIHI